MNIIRTSKQRIKQALDNKIGKEEYSLEDICARTKVVSFDVFDTLVVRDVNKPSDVFKIMENSLGIIGFHEKRIEAERIARENKQNTNEVTIDDIYRAYEGISPENANEYIKKELQTEISLCHPNLDIIPLYEKCKEKYKVIIVSDMYLPANMMEKILNSCSITGYEKIYVSCDVEKSKYNGGELFDFIADDLGISSNEITHIGDDFKSDYLNAKKKSIQSMKIRKQKTNRLISGCSSSGYQKDDVDQFDIIYNYLNNTTHRETDFYYRFGYENVGILLWSFCKWLINKMSSQNIEQVLFIARDGYMMKEVYDVMGFSKVIPSYYFEMSRRSAMIPATFSQGLDYDEMLKVIRLPACVRVGQLLEAWGLDETKYKDILDELSVDKNREYRTPNLKNEQVIRNLYERVAGDIESNAKREYRLFIEYLKHFNFEKNTALVDIGWSATIQKELLKTFKSEKSLCNLKGYYLALDRRASLNSEDLYAEGFLWDHYNNDNDEMEEGAFVGLIETLFHEQAGSVKGYVYDGESVVADRYHYEYLMSGNICDEINSLAQIQQGAIDFTKELGNRGFSDMICIECRQAFHLLRKCLMEPSSKMISAFGNFRYFDMGEYTYLARPKISSVKYLLHPRKFVTDFYESEWPIGFFKAVIKLNISYERLWNSLMAIKKSIIV